MTVAERGGEVAGLLVLGVDEEVLLENVAARQGAGVGRALLEHAEGAARRGGFDSLHLFAHARRAGNPALYRRLGSVESARRRHGEDVPVHMRRRPG